MPSATTSAASAKRRKSDEKTFVFPHAAIYVFPVSQKNENGWDSAEIESREETRAFFHLSCDGTTQQTLFSTLSSAENCLKIIDSFKRHNQCIALITKSTITIALT